MNELTCTVLIENTAPPHLHSEYGVAFHIQYGGQSILLDSGSSGAFADNAETLGIDLSRVDWTVLSHGHSDHSDGFLHFFALNETAPLYLRKNAGAGYYALSDSGARFVGINRELWQGEHSRLRLLENGPFQPAPGVWLLPALVTGGGFETLSPHLVEKTPAGEFILDVFSHEQSLAFETKQGLVLLNSCGHVGLVNSVKSALRQLPGRRVHTLIGGLHLLKPGTDELNCGEEQVIKIAQALMELGVEQLYTGHCTGTRALALLKEQLGEGVQGMTAGSVIRV